MRNTLVGLLVTFAALAPATAVGSSTHHRHRLGLSEKYQHEYWSCVRRYDSRKPCGRNIVNHGVKYGHHPARPASKHEKAKSTRQLRRLNAPYVVSPVPPPQAPARISTAGGNPNVDPSCESGGNPQVYDPTGTYWGKYQFDEATWNAYANPGENYGSAPESVQDQVASRVTYDAWPNC